MKNIFIIFLSLVLVSSCSKNGQQNNDSTLKTDSISTVNRSESVIEEEYPSNPLIENIWGNDNIRLLFDASLALNYETNSCIYFFDYRYENNEIVATWKLDTINCSEEVGLFQIENPPLEGEDFATYNLVKDTLLKVNYSNAALMKNINDKLGFELFPETIKIIKQ